ncbi:MAG TPA: hypothetical protein VK213_12010 [Bacteroidales bacterium]|nr:hypothetical protein [Bacteroidales bacterium]
MKAFTVVLSLFITSMVFSQKGSYSCQWRSSEEKVTLPALQYSEKGKFQYQLSNDNANLFVDLKITDKNVQRQILTSGLTLWISPDGKKVKKSGVRYPAQQPPQGQDAAKMQGPPRGRPAPAQANTMELIGLGNNDGFITVPGDKGFSAIIKQELDGVMIYDVKLPLAEITSPGSSLEPGALAVGFEYKGFSGPATGGARPSGGGGRMPSGSARPGPQPGGPQGTPPAETKTLFWLTDINLAKAE